MLNTGIPLSPYCLIIKPSKGNVAQHELTLSLIVALQQRAFSLREKFTPLKSSV